MITVNKVKVTGAQVKVTAEDSEFGQEFIVLELAQEQLGLNQIGETKLVKRTATMPVVGMSIEEAKTYIGEEFDGNLLKVTVKPYKIVDSDNKEKILTQAWRFRAIE